jgi:hypothetical protein
MTTPTPHFPTDKPVNPNPHENKSPAGGPVK